MPFAAVDQMLVFASYARKDTWRPALVGFFSIVVYLLTALLLLPSLDLLSLMVADAVKHVVHALIMIWLLRRQIGGLDGYGIISSAAKSLLAAIASGLAAYAAVTALATLPLQPDTLVSRLLAVIGGGAAGLLVYGGAAWALNIQEIRSLAQLLRQRL
jgi:putative peptidoglycan lipid II flippase